MQYHRECICLIATCCDGERLRWTPGFSRPAGFLVAAVDNFKNGKSACREWRKAFFLNETMNTMNTMNLIHGF